MDISSPRRRGTQRPGPIGTGTSRWRPRAFGAVLSGAAVALGLLSCAREPTPRPSIVILSLDTLRADHLSACGYPRGTTPRLDGLAAQGVTFADARCQSTATLTSHLSLMTSLLPDHFRITRADGENVDMFRTRLRLPEAVVTLAEALRDEGYETAAFTGGGFVAARYGLDQGFDVYEENRTRFDGLASTFPRVRAFLQRREEQSRTEGVEPRPLLLFVHTYDIHEPYRSPSPFETFYSRESFRTLAARLGHPPAPAKLNERLDSVDAATGRDVRDLYDNGIRATDTMLAWLFELLRQHGLYDESILAVVSDHGEEFLDHGRFGHGATVYDELARVPLLLRLPDARRRGTIVTEPVALLDLAPTLLELVGASVPPSFQGRSLVPLLEGRRDPSRRHDSILLHDPTTPEVRGIVLDGRKLIERPDGSVELYDLDADPAERRDLSESSQQTDELLDRLATACDGAHESALRHGWLAEPMEGEEGTLPEDAREQLEALGYVK